MRECVVQFGVWLLLAALFLGLGLVSVYSGVCASVGSVFPSVSREQVDFNVYAGLGFCGVGFCAVGVGIWVFLVLRSTEQKKIGYNYA